MFISGGFFLPTKGLERFCGAEVYVGVLLDTYDITFLDNNTGKFREPSEINNVKWSHQVSITGLKCDLNEVPEKKCK